MNILLISPAPGLSGGISRWTGHILNYYKKKQEEDVNLVFLPIETNGFPHTNLLSFFHRVSTRTQLYLSLLQKAKQLIEEQKIDVVHLCSSGSLGFVRDLLLIRMAHKLGVKVVVHMHFGRIPDLLASINWESYLLRAVLKCADGIITIDESSFKAANQVKTKATIVNIPNPLAPEVLDILSAMSPALRHDRRLLFVGQMLRTKGVVELVKACSTIEDIELVMVGSLPHQDVIEELHHIAGENSNWLTIMGEQSFETIVEEMSKCDLFVFPTYTEGFPNVILESMACGCAIISTDVGAIKEMLAIGTEERCGVLVEPRNVESLRSGIVSLLANEALKVSCRAKSKDRVVHYYNIDSIWNKMSSFWHTIQS